MKVFISILLKLGDRAPDKDTIIFAYIYILKENIYTQMSLQRPNLLFTTEKIAERADTALFRGMQQRRQGI